MHSFVSKHTNQITARIRAFAGKPGLGRLRKILVAVLGGSVVLIGIAMIVLPVRYSRHSAGIDDSGNGVHLGKAMVEASAGTAPSGNKPMRELTN